MKNIEVFTCYEIVMDGNSIVLRIGEKDKNSISSGIMTLINSKKKESENDCYNQNKTHFRFWFDWGEINYSLEVNKSTAEGVNFTKLVKTGDIKEINDYSTYLFFSKIGRNHISMMLKRARLEGMKIGEIRFKEKLQNLICISEDEQIALNKDDSRDLFAD